jgi:hypothetical protein
VLPRLQPDRFLLVVRLLEIGHRDQMQVAPLDGFSNYFDSNTRGAVQLLEQPKQTGMGVGRDMSNPNPFVLRAELQRRFLLLVVPIHRREVLPMLVIIAEHWNGVGVHRTGARLVVVLTDEVRQRQRGFAVLHAIDAEVVPVRLPVAAVFVALAFDVTTKLGITELLNFSQRPTLEVLVERDDAYFLSGTQRDQPQRNEARRYAKEGSMISRLHRLVLPILSHR